MKHPNWDLERTFWEHGVQLVVGVDEVGRGSVAGPVSAGAVIFPKITPKVPGLRDSKQMTARQRERAFALINNTALEWAVGFGSVKEINQIGIVPATDMAIQRAIDTLSNWQQLIMDGNRVPELRSAGRGVVATIKADESSVSVAAASVMAKVTRDAFMMQLAKDFPEYGWERNKGYGTPEHRRAFERRGATRWHRNVFVQSWIPYD